MRELIIALLALAALISSPARPNDEELPDVVARALERAGVPQSAVGLHVFDLASEQVVLDFAGDRLFNPASVMKLITTYAALEVLGPAFTWQTEVYVDGPVIDGHLRGNAYFKGHGDPGLTFERFWLFLRELKSRGLKHIEGDVFLDRSAFATGYHDPAEFDGEPTRPYNVGADALLLNYKTFLLRFIPNEQTGKVDIIAEPELDDVNIINNLALGRGHCNYWPRTPTHSGTTLAFTGVFPSGCGEKARYYSLLEPDAYFGTVFRRLWSELGGSVTGNIQAGAVPTNAVLFASLESAPLAQVVRETNKFSNNVMARHLYLTLGLEHDYPLTSDKARTVLNAWLDKAGLDFSDLAIENGSGLSRSSRISPRQLGQMLIAAWHSPLMPELVASLPLVAVDGTMRTRLDSSPIAGQAHIKSGYLDNVRAIAGYVNDRRGHVVAVVFFINHDRARFAASALDGLLEWAYSAVAE